MSRADKKERNRLKRKQKKLDQRRKQAQSPYKAVAADGQPLACYITRDWKKEGIGNLFVLKRMRSGDHAMGAFLIDFWCLGLKDAWGQLSITTLDFDERIRKGLADRGAPIERIEVDLARRLLAGSIRFARENRFRLPRRFDRWAPILGIDPGATDADLSEFGVEDGRLRYVGDLDDLAKRFIGDVDDLLMSAKFDYIGGLGTDDEFEDFYEDEDDDHTEGDFEEDSDEDKEGIDLAELDKKIQDQQAVEEIAGTFKENLIKAYHQWSARDGRQPHPLAEFVVDSLIEGLLQRELQEGESLEPDAPVPDSVVDESIRLYHRALELHPTADPQELRAADIQFREFQKSFATFEEFCKIAMTGIGDENEDSTNTGEQP